MKLIIQIPCYNEEESLPITLADLPREVPGSMWSSGSSSTMALPIARSRWLAHHGVDHIVRLTNNKGLAAGFQAGLDAGLKLGADVIVNTDADNQYSAADIPRLVEPIPRRHADMVVGDRQVETIEHFSPLKVRLQHLGSWVVRQASSTTVPDTTTSGFRAYNREAATAARRRLEVHLHARDDHPGRQAARRDRRPRPDPHERELRESRLFPSMWAYVRRNSVSIASGSTRSTSR